MLTQHPACKSFFVCIYFSHLHWLFYLRVLSPGKKWDTFSLFAMSHGAVGYLVVLWGAWWMGAGCLHKACVGVGQRGREAACSWCNVETTLKQRWNSTTFTVDGDTVKEALNPNILFPRPWKKTLRVYGYSVHWSPHFRGRGRAALGYVHVLMGRGLDKVLVLFWHLIAGAPFSLFFPLPAQPALLHHCVSFCCSGGVSGPGVRSLPSSNPLHSPSGTGSCCSSRRTYLPHKTYKDKKRREKKTNTVYITSNKAATSPQQLFDPPLHQPTKRS